MQFVIPSCAEHCKFIRCFIAIYSNHFFSHVKKNDILASSLFVFLNRFTTRNTTFSDDLLRVYSREWHRRAKFPATRVKTLPIAFVNPSVAHSTHVVCTLALQIRTSNDRFPVDLFCFFVTDPRLLESLSQGFVMNRALV